MTQKIMNPELRQMNIIIKGLEEDRPLKILNETEINTDINKVRRILTEINCEQSEIVKMNRIGEKTGKIRPIKVTLKTKQDRTKILSNSKKLKNSNHIFAKIYINKDQHPSILSEHRRLKELERIERCKPENTGHIIKYDWKNRCLKADDKIIAMFNQNIISEI